MSQADNLAVWDRRGRPRGHYEVWYLTLTDLASGAAFWIRYTLEAPSAPDEAPSARVWFTSFGEGAVALLRDVAISGYAPGEGGAFEVRMGECVLSHGRAEGRIGDRARWSLRWTPPADSHRPLPPVAYRLPITSTTVLSPAPAVLFDGVIECGGRTYVLAGAPGCQTHLWGRKHAETWAWARASAWDDGADAFFEGIVGRVRRFGRVLPPLTVVSLRVDGTTHHLRGLLQARRTASAWETGRWTFDAQGPTARISGEVTHPPADLVLARYHDPDGQASYCHNSEVASAVVRLSTRAGRGGEWSTPRILTAKGLAHAEWGARSPDPRAARSIEAC